MSHNIPDVIVRRNQLFHQREPAHWSFWIQPWTLQAEFHLILIPFAIDPLAQHAEMALHLNLICVVQISAKAWINMSVGWIHKCCDPAKENEKRLHLVHRFYGENSLESEREMHMCMRDSITTEMLSNFIRHRRTRCLFASRLTRSTRKCSSSSIHPCIASRSQNQSFILCGRHLPLPLNQSRNLVLNTSTALSPLLLIHASGRTGWWITASSCFHDKMNWHELANDKMRSRRSEISELCQNYVCIVEAHTENFENYELLSLRLHQ